MKPRYALPLLFLACACGHTTAPPGAPPLRATIIDRATTQPSYWLARPTVASVTDRDFFKLWHACEKTARSYLFQIDLEDYREGVLTTLPMASKLPVEFWRKDTGDFAGEIKNSLTTTRRTLRFEFTRAAGDTFTMTPKVLVEQETVLERRTTDEAQYQTMFSGPGTTHAQDATDVEQEVPVLYWTPIARDTEMEKQVAAEVRRRLR